MDVIETVSVWFMWAGVGACVLLVPAIVVALLVESVRSGK